MPPRRQVVIVGGGPVGVALALALGLRGISCAVIERRTELSSIPKGQGLSQRSVEHFARLGLADQLRAARAMPPGHPIGQVTVYRDLRSDFWHAAAARELVAPFYAQANERLPQYRTEEVLRRRLAELPDVDVHLGWQATEVHQHADGVRVVATRDGAELELVGDYVVGCDGGRSIVREQADIPRSGTDFDELVALVVFRSKEFHQALERFPARSTYRVMHPDLKGYWMFFGRVDVGEEFFFHGPVPPGTTTENFDFAAFLHQAAGFPFESTIDHVGFWDLRVQVADEYRRGRAFIAGDAAHTHPPYGGFGLNNGLEDAVNLGWKLAAVLDGWGGPALLDSYSPERQAVFRDVGEEIIGGWIREDRAVLEEYSPETDREEFERAFAEVAAGFGKRLRHFEPNYEGSSVVLGPPGGVNSGLGTHSFQARPGHHLAPQPSSAGGTVFDALGPDFTLLALDAGDDAVAAFSEAAAEAGVPLTVVQDTFDGGREAYGSRLVLVRPDQFVVWTGDTVPADVGRVLSRVTGRG
ncbi:FAD-dependent monooxygenase [Modestobacter marinus]|uniref:FAD-dependent monooxygenase n=1 Tax=Modestobacter marinus TaxID=477641 RepID=UPI00201A4BF1|nr:FAD-dependent monooxygenase [Modestobacter marinus]